MSFNDKETLDYRTRGGIRVERRLIRQPYEGAVEPLVDALERRRGVLLVLELRVSRAATPAGTWGSSTRRWC